MPYQKEENKIFWNALNLIKGLGPKNMQILANSFSSAQNIWKASKKDLEKTNLSSSLIEKIIQQRKNINPEREWQKLLQHQIKILTIEEENYPQLLKEIPNPPFLIYYKGNGLFNQSPALAIVGSRKFTSYGKQVAYSLTKELVQAGITIVSGMALGIDSIAHKASLENQGTTFAILGNSLEDKFIYPRNHFHLAQQIQEQGLLISDYPLGTPASSYTFPARNRLMAGLTLGTIIIEATRKSGTLITARLALEFNREVFAVPGSILSPSSFGPHKLIQQGAKLVTQTQDILNELNLTSFAKEKEKRKKEYQDKLSQEEKKIIQHLSQEPLHINQLAQLSHLEISTLTSFLTLLEIKNLIKDIGGKNYILL